MSDCPNDPSNGYGSYNTTHTLPCSVPGCDCALRKDAERYRHLRANFASVGMGGVELIWDQPDPQDALDELVDFAMRAEQFPGVDIDAAHKA